MLRHSENINAIMIAIKPGYYSYYFVKFTKEMLKEYFKKVRLNHLQNIQKLERDKLITAPRRFENIEIPHTPFKISSHTVTESSNI